MLHNGRLRRCLLSRPVSAEYPGVAQLEDVGMPAPVDQSSRLVCRHGLSVVPGGIGCVVPRVYGYMS